jgi:hypothetical protein
METSIHTKKVDGYDNYFIMNNGKVITKGFKKGGKSFFIKHQKDKNGYSTFHAGKDINGKRKHLKIHRLVAESFIPNPLNLPQVNHKNGIKTDNRVENLEWVTCSGNQLHASKVLGINNIRNIINSGKKKSYPVHQIKDGKIIKTWPNAVESEKFGFDRKAISACCLGIRKSHAGFQWSYE